MENKLNHTEEPIVLPRPKVLPSTRPSIPLPDEDDPFNIPAPLVDPTIKGNS